MTSIGQNVMDDLRIWGPAHTGPRVTLSEARRYCRLLATSHYENFPVATGLLPKPLIPPFYSLYAYCRWADDLGDEAGSPEEATRLLAWWRAELDLCFAGQPRHPVLIALWETIREYQLPRQPFEDLISAFEQDQSLREYETFEQLLDYCRRSADPVGRLVLGLFRQATPENIRWSDSICTGLQLANFWQDVARDWQIGRIYLPAEDRARFGVTREELGLGHSSDRFIELLRFEVDRAETYLHPWKSSRMDELASFPWRQQVELELFARGGLTILARIREAGYRVLEQRPTVSKSDFLKLGIGCLWHSLQRSWTPLRTDRHATPGSLHER